MGDEHICLQNLTFITRGWSIFVEIIEKVPLPRVTIKLFLALGLLPVTEKFACD